MVVRNVNVFHREDDPRGEDRVIVTVNKTSTGTHKAVLPCECQYWGLDGKMLEAVAVVDEHPGPIQIVGLYDGPTPGTVTFVDDEVTISNEYEDGVDGLVDAHRDYFVWTTTREEDEG